MLSHLWTHRSLIVRFSLRDFRIRYQGTVLGGVWSLVMPLIMLAVYTFVFSVVFKARWGEQEATGTSFAIILFANLIPFNLLSEIIGSSSGLIIHNQNLVKKVVFPLEILPLTRVISVLLQCSLNLLILVGCIALFGTLHWQLLLFPLVLTPLLFLALGFAFIIAALTVFVRDITQVVGVALTLLLFLSPIFYPVSALPPTFQNVILLNPLTVIVEQFRSVVVLGQLPDPFSTCSIWISSTIFCALGYALFMKIKPSFADVI